MNELEERYGDPQVIAAAYIKRALGWPAINGKDPTALDHFAIFLSECEYAICSMDAMKVLEYPDNLRKLVSKLPYYMHDRWRKIVYSSQEASFNQLVSFVRAEAKKDAHPVFGKKAMSASVPDKVQKSTGKRSHNSTPKHYDSHVAISQV